MAQPSVAINRLDLSMTYAEFSLRANRMNFGGLKIMPPLVVGNLSQSTFPRINLKSLLTNVSKSDKRAPYGTYARDTFEWDSDTYGLSDHGVEETVDDALIEMYGDIIDAETVATERAVDRVIRRLEVDIAAGLFTAAFTYKTAIATPWSTYASATPITDIYNAISAVELRTGVTPNKLIVTDLGWRDLKQTEQIKDLLSSGSNDNPDQISKAGLLKMFDELDDIIVVKGFTNNANSAQAPSLGRVWDTTMAMVARCSSSGINDNDLTDVDPHLGRTLFHQDSMGLASGASAGEQSIIIEEYREEARRGGVCRARNWRQVKTLHTACAQLLTGVR